MRDSLKDAKKQALADIAYVQSILRIWDPIGVLPDPGDDQGPMDEYDSYAPQLVTLLREGATVNKIQDRLSEIRTKSMGLAAYPEKDRPTAEQLVSWWKKNRKPMTEIEQLWQESLRYAFPREVNGATINGVDLTEVDSFSAGCISSFIDSKGTLDQNRVNILKSCISDLEKIILTLEGEAKRYFEKRLRLGKLVISAVEK